MDPNVQGNAEVRNHRDSDFQLLCVLYHLNTGILGGTFGMTESLETMPSKSETVFIMITEGDVQFTSISFPIN